MQDIMPRYKATERLPMKWTTIVTVAALFAGTQRRKIKAVLGLLPLAMRLAARGVEASQS